jgi:hypothetical protein
MIYAENCLYHGENGAIVAIKSCFRQIGDKAAYIYL